VGESDRTVYSLTKRRRFSTAGPSMVFAFIEGRHLAVYLIVTFALKFGITMSMFVVSLFYLGLSMAATFASILPLLGLFIWHNIMVTRGHLRSRRALELMSLFSLCIAISSFWGVGGMPVHFGLSSVWLATSALALLLLRGRIYKDMAQRFYVPWAEYRARQRQSR